MNPLAVVFWALLAIVGWLIVGTLNGVLVFVGAGLAISLLAGALR